jgi:hypothetical protein
MAHQILDSDVYTTVINVPDGTDSRANAANVVEAIAQALANRTRYIDLRARKVGILNTADRTPAASYTGNWRGVTFGVLASLVRRWVIVGEVDAIQYSNDDGKSWAAGSGTSGAGVFYGVAYGGGVFVAVGASDTTGSSTPKIYSSTDGVSWTSRTPGGTNPAGTSLRAITYASGKFVAVGTNGQIQTSTDGVTWTKRTPFNATDHFYAVTMAAYSPNKWVAAGCTSGGAAVVQSSNDGYTWNARNTFPAGAGLISAIVSSPTELLTFGTLTTDTQPTVVHRSYDTFVWSPETTFNKTVVSGAVYHKGMYVACTYASTDPTFGQATSLIAGVAGGGWTMVPGPNGNQSLHAIGASPSRHIVVGSGGAIATSLYNAW